MHLEHINETHTSSTIPEKLESNIKDLEEVFDAKTMHLHNKTKPYIPGILGSTIVFSSVL